MEFYNSVEGGSGIIANFDNWYELHRLDFWAWVLVGIIFVGIIVWPIIREWREK